jgi:hypothetical protein
MIKMQQTAQIKHSLAVVMLAVGIPLAAERFVQQRLDLPGSSGLV